MTETDKIKCKYKDICTSYNLKCNSCKHNENIRRDYYSPINEYESFNDTSNTISYSFLIPSDVDG